MKTHIVNRHFKMKIPLLLAMTLVRGVLLLNHYIVLNTTRSNYSTCFMMFFIFLFATT